MLIHTASVRDRQGGVADGENPRGHPRRDRVVREPEPPLDCDVVFSSLPADVAGPVETRFARAGYAVLSNSAAHRMDEQVPLLVPEVNPDHLALLDACGDGFIVTNPNCSTVM